MALTERTEIDRVEVVQQWNIQVRQNTTIERDGQFVSNSFHRWVLTPDIVAIPPPGILCVVVYGTDSDNFFISTL